MLGLADGAHGLVFQKGGVSVVEAFQLFAGNGLADEVFHGGGKVHFIRRHDREGVPRGFGTARTADAVYVVFRVFRNAVVDDVGNAADVNPARGHVRSHQNFVFAGLESLERLHAFFSFRMEMMSINCTS